jgi:hypothetical protein
MRRVLALFLLLALAGCSRSYTRSVTAWCEARVREPVRLGGGMIQAGFDPRETLRVKRGVFIATVWVDVAQGSGGRVMRLAGDRAILFMPKLGAEALVVTPDGAVRPIASVFPCDGFRTVSPDGKWIDCARCAPGTSTACSHLSLERVSPDGAHAGSATIDAPDESCQFRRAYINWYDRPGRAYVLASCAKGSRVLFRTDFTGLPERFTTPGGTEDKATWHDAIGRFALLPWKGSEPLHGQPNTAIPP